MLSSLTIQTVIPTFLSQYVYTFKRSICGLSNANVALASKAPILLIGKSGVGDAVDSYNLNASYFESMGLTVMGGIFNKFELDGFYSLDACKG